MDPLNSRDADLPIEKKASLVIKLKIPNLGHEADAILNSPLQIPTPLPNPPLDSSFRCAQLTEDFSLPRTAPINGFSIESYIPVGCLRLYRWKISISKEVWESHTTWCSFAQSYNPLDHDNEVILAPEIQHALSEGLKEYGYRPSRKDLCRYGWIRMEFMVNLENMNTGQVRVYVLPDDLGRIKIPRDDIDMRKQLFSMLDSIDISPDTFDGSWDPYTSTQYIDSSLNSTEEEVVKELSLLHIFNHLPSPNPSPSIVQDEYASDAMRDLLANKVRGLRANLFKFQGRTAASMLQREAQPTQHLDPRLIVRKDQSGGTWYVNIVTGEWLRNPRFIDDPRGGILAEHMGRGKTLICLALIMATRGHYPDMPLEHSEAKMPVRSRVGSLMEMTAARIACSNVPWKLFFEELLIRDGEEYSKCIAEIRTNASYYLHKPVQFRTSSRLNCQSLPDRKIYRAATTLVIVPPNLVDQWLNEIEKHTAGLNILVMKDAKKQLPQARQLLEYDLVLFSRTRLEKEFSEGFDRWTGTKIHDSDCSIYGNRSHENHDCSCGQSTPLLDVHFKRVITDEGHFIGNAGARSASIAVQVMNSLAVDSRWVVSGTPTQGLYGVEESKTLNDRYNAGHVNATEKDHIQQSKDVERIGNISTAFLKAEPWTSEPGSWARFNMQTRLGDNQISSVGDPERLRAIMENTVLRTRAEDVEPQITLPPLHQKIVYLNPSVQDAIQLNIFILNIIANAITSERQDADYFFHPSQRKPLNELVRNLRQASFFWCGWTIKNVTSTVSNATEFLSNHKTPFRENDEAELREAIKVGENILKLICSYPEQSRLLIEPDLERTSPSAPLALFEAAIQTHEIPIFVGNDFPADVRRGWALDESDSIPTLFGFTQLKEFSDLVTSQLWKPDPFNGLDEAGVKAMNKCREQDTVESNSKGREAPKDGGPASQHQMPIPKNTDPTKGKKRPMGGATSPSPLAGGATVGRNISPRKPRRHILTESSGNASKISDISADSALPTNIGDGTEHPLKSALKKGASVAQKPTIDPESKLASAYIESTASAKLTYLIEQILKVKDQEKSIIFYEEEAVGYYIAQALEAIGVEHLIYAKAKTLSSALQSRWLRKFADEDNVRVLLLDLGAGTFGLDVSSASRVFFVRPVFNPQVEAQAIKRAHRIGQTKPVFVEILVMRSSMEEKMVERRKELSDGDFNGFKSILDDAEMYEWVKNPKFVPLPDVGDGVLSDIPKQDTMAKLNVPHRIFGSLIKKPGDGAGIQDVEAPRKKITLKLRFGSIASSSPSENIPPLDSESEPPKKKKKTVGFRSP